MGFESRITNLAGEWTALRLSSSLLLIVARSGILGWMKVMFLHSLVVKRAQVMLPVGPQIPRSCVWSRRQRDTF